MEHLDLLKANGVTVENLKDLTNEKLAEFGMEKFMHRKRFLRYSGEMHRKLETDLTEEEKKAKWKREKAAYDEKKRLEKAAHSDHDFKMTCTDYGRKSGACK
jgi:hypothetical protein